MPASSEKSVENEKSVSVVFVLRNTTFTVCTPEFWANVSLSTVAMMSAREAVENAKSASNVKEKSLRMGIVEISGDRNVG